MFLLLLLYIPTRRLDYIIYILDEWHPTIYDIKIFNFSFYWMTRNDFNNCSFDRRYVHALMKFSGVFFIFVDQKQTN